VFARRSHAFDAYVAPAAPKRALWRLILGLLIVVIGWVAWTILVLGLHVLLDVLGGMDLTVALGRLEGLIEGGSPEAIAWLLATFIGIWLALWIALSVLHKRSLGSVIAPDGAVSTGAFGFGLVLAALFTVVSMVIALIIGGAPARTELGFADWMPWLAPLAILVLIQASAEEAIFRGYMVQGLAVRFRSAVIWGGLPAVLFGLLHYAPDLPGIGGLLYPLITFLFGLAATVLVWRSGSLAAAMGLHTGINIFGLTVVGLEGHLTGAQLWAFPIEKAEPLMLGDALATALLLGFVLSPLCPRPGRDASAAGA